MKRCMQTYEAIKQGYRVASRQTLLRWREHDGAGQPLTTPFYPPDRLSITTGIKAAPTAAIRQLLTELRLQVGNDPLADVMAEQGLHFTLLALTPAQFGDNDVIGHLPALQAVFRACCGDRFMRLDGLHLVALPNQLLLAGYPDEASLAARGQLAQQILTSPWGEALRERYKNDPLPPLFWHSTLLRYQAEYLPEQLRRFYLSHQHQTYGGIAAPMVMMLADYHWQKAKLLA